MQSRQQFSSLDELRSRLVGQLECMLDASADADRWLEGLVHSLALLNAMPLTSHEFSVAVNRLQNARRYLVAKEPGAARYELRLVLASLKNGEREKTVRRHWRKRHQRDRDGVA